MKNKIELLSTDLLTDNINKSYIYHWQKAFKKKLGWHYILDFVWILTKIQNLRLKRGSVILDAGGGHGLLQFILCDMGYNVVSVDLQKRMFNMKYNMLFDIQYNYNSGSIKSEYLKHLKVKVAKYKKVLTPLLHYFRIAREILTIDYIVELLKNNKFNRGKLYLTTADLKRMNMIKTASIDAIVSVSAIEHIEKRSDTKKAIDELKRVLKPKGVMFLTTSFTNKPSWFHHPSKGWCFSQKDLCKVFNIKYNNTINYQKELMKMDGCEELKNSLASYYFNNKNTGMPDGIWNPQYLPIGVIFHKR